MPTSKKVYINGKLEPPRRKVKLARSVDWQAVVRKLQVELDKKSKEK